MEVNIEKLALPAVFEQCSFEKLVQKIKNVFQMCSFSDINFSNAKIPRIHLLDCVAFTNVDFSNAELESAVLSGISAGGDTCVKFDNAVLTTTNFEKSLKWPIFASTPYAIIQKNPHSRGG